MSCIFLKNRNTYPPGFDSGRVDSAHEIWSVGGKGRTGRPSCSGCRCARATGRRCSRRKNPGYTRCPQGPSQWIERPSRPQTALQVSDSHTNSPDVCGQSHRFGTGRGPPPTRHYRESLETAGQSASASPLPPQMSPGPLAPESGAGAECVPPAGATAQAGAPVRGEGAAPKQEGHIVEACPPAPTAPGAAAFLF